MAGQKTAAEEGAASHKRGDARSACPYPKGSPEEVSWHVAYGTSEALEKRAPIEKAHAAEVAARRDRFRFR